MVDQHHPLARSERIVVESVGEELLVYDLDSDRAHSLDPVAAAIWRACEGERPVAEIARRAGVSEDAAWSTLDELSELDLLAAPLPAPAAHSRRALLRRGLVAGAAGVAAITTITAPAAAGLTSCLPNGSSCATGLQCCSQLCCGAPTGTCADSC